MDGDIVIQMNEMNRMESLEFHLKVKNLFQKVKQVSWNIKQLENNFKEPEYMSTEEIDRLTAFYLAMGIDLEDLADDLKPLLKLWKEKTGK